MGHARVDFVDRLARERLIAILRAPAVDRFVAVAHALYEGGWRAIEVTLTTAGAFDAITEIRAKLPDDAWVGAGTVMTPDDVRAVHAAGAQFAVSPVLDPASVAAADQLELPFVAGALTPTEILAAWYAGCPAVKVSPVVSVGGPAYLDQVGAFLPGIPLLPTGGVRPEEVPAYLQAGAIGVGLGGPLVGDALTPSSDPTALTALTRRAAAVAAVVAAAGPYRFAW